MDEEAEMMARREEDLAGKLEGENVKVKGKRKRRKKQHGARGSA